MPEKQRQALKQDTTVFAHFVKAENGQFIVFSEDARIHAFVRNILKDELADLRQSVLVRLGDPTRFLAVIHGLYAAEGLPLVLMEEALGGRDFGFLMRQFRNAFPDLLLVALSEDARADHVALLRESGADAVFIKPGSPEVLCETLRVLLQTGLESRRAVTTIRKALQGNRKVVLQQCAAAIASSSVKLPFLLMLGDLLHREGEEGLAESAFAAACRLAPEDPLPWRKLAEQVLAAERWEEGITLLRKADSLSPRNAERKVQMGALCLKLGRDQEAGALFASAVRCTEQEAALRIASVTAHIAGLCTGWQTELEERYLRQSLAPLPGLPAVTPPHVLNQLGITLRRQGKWREAAGVYDQALSLAPDDSVLHFNLGLACLEGGDYETAASRMTSALELNPELPLSSAGVAYNMGSAFLLAGLRPLAEQCLAAALKQNPEFEAARRALDSIHAR